MGQAEDDAAKAFYGFYDALDELLRAKGTEHMEKVWHHADYVTTVHPFGHWARGWKEVWATWQEGAAVFAIYKGHEGKDERIGGISELHVAVRGDVAHGTSRFQSKLYMTEGELILRVNCTNIAHRIDGEWKIVHHHADQAPPEWQAQVGRMVERGHS